MKVFLAGVMQGNMKEHGIRSQNYRKEIADIVLSVLPGAEIIDPDITDPDRLSYTKEQSADMFFRYCNMAGEVDLLISFIPEASMGSAVEMWMAHKANIPVLTISPLDHNWVVKLLSRKVFPTTEVFKENFSQAMLSDLGLL